MTVNEWAKDFRSFVNELQIPRDDYNGIMEYIDDVIALLKKQEAVEPARQIEQTEWTVCGNCRKHIISKWTFCPYCGRQVKWND